MKLYRAPSQLPAFRMRMRARRVSDITTGRLVLRRQRFIRENRLSATEAAYLPINYNPGPEYDCP